MATKQEITDTIRRGNQRVTQTFDGLTEQQLDTRVHFDDIGWTARQLLAHLAGRAPGHERMIAMAGSGAGFPPDFDVNAFNQEIVDARVGKSRDALIAEFLIAHDALIERVNGMSDEQLAATMQWRTGEIPLSDVLRGSGGQHSLNHAAEMEKVLGLPDRNGLASPFAAIHHVALVTNDMKRTVAFYRDVLGSEIAMGHRLDRPGNERHYFITVAPNTMFAFFEFPDAELPAHKDATLPSTGRSLDHIAFFAGSNEQFDTWYQRLTEAKAAYLSPIRDMGIVRAFFFDDPNGITLEVMAGMGEHMHFPSLSDPDPAY
ncbi:MAG: VOC family protein [Chloroflexota bacterium]|nr:VOC family protein [Chloroflexota bacterium]